MVEKLINGQVSSWGILLEKAGCIGYADANGIYHIEEIESH